MHVSRILVVLGLVVVHWACPSSATAQVTADDFLPVVQGGSAEVKQPEKVVVNDKVVTAATAQDAINAAVQENKKKLKATEAPEVGAKMVKFPSGLGFVASGVAPYRTMDNPVATRIAKRKAYVIAFTQAKKGLAEILGGLSNEGKETIREAMVNINLPKEEMTNISTHSDEAVKQAVEMMLRGFVIYEVKDDTEAKHGLRQHRYHAEDARQAGPPGTERRRSRQHPRGVEPGDRRGSRRAGAAGRRADHHDAVHGRNGLRRLRQHAWSAPATTRPCRPS